MPPFTRKRLLVVLVFLCSIAVVLTRSDQIGKADAGPFIIWTAPATADPGLISAAASFNSEAVAGGAVGATPTPLSPTPQMVEVTVGTNPSGLSFTVDSVTYTSSHLFFWPLGSEHTISTTSPQGGSLARYIWDNWSDGGAISHNIFALGTPTYTANFHTQYYLAMITNSGGSVSPPSGWHDAGQQVQSPRYLTRASEAALFYPGPARGPGLTRVPPTP